jgi:membrane protein implicated in regulation of membrane protease activity
MVGVLLVLLWVVCAGVAAVVAHYRMLPVGKFTIAGLLLGPAGVVWAALATPYNRAERRRQEEIDRAMGRIP